MAPVAATEGLGGSGSCGVSDSNSNNSNPQPHSQPAGSADLHSVNSTSFLGTVAAPDHLWAVWPSPFVPSTLLRQLQTVPWLKSPVWNFSVIFVNEPWMLQRLAPRVMAGNKSSRMRLGLGCLVDSNDLITSEKWDPRTSWDAVTSKLLQLSKLLKLRGCVRCSDNWRVNSR